MVKSLTPGLVGDDFLCLTINVRADSTPASTAVKPLTRDARKVFERHRITVDLFGFNPTKTAIRIDLARPDDRGKLVVIPAYDGPPRRSFTGEVGSRRPRRAVVQSASLDR